MELKTRQLLESGGFQILEGGWDFKFKTRIFIRHPDGRLNPYYDYLYQIPMLPNGTEIDLAKTAMPEDEGFGSTAIEDAGAITNVDMGLDAQGLPIPVIVGYIILAFILLAIVIAIYYLIHPPAQPPPCGTSGAVVEVGDCAKIITMPNCDSRMYNSCTDEWMEEEWHEYTAEMGLIQWIVIGALAIGGIYVAAKVLPGLIQKEAS